jgi:hypothetical protein
MILNIRTFIAIALPIVAFALTPSAATAQSYSGNWPVTVTKLQIGSTATYCLTLTDNGGAGRKHSGPASLSGASPSGSLTGTFQLIGTLLTVTIQSPSDSGQDAGLVFVASASKGDIDKGIFDEVFGGEELDSGAVSLGTKNSCTP